MHRTFKIIAAIAALLFFGYHAMCKPVYTAFSVKVTGHGQPVILLPGATCAGAEWNETVAHLKDRYECHVLTLAGYAGIAPLPSAPYLATIEQQLKQYIADNRLKNVTVIGHSIGGVLAMWLATDMKRDLSRVVIVDAMPFFALVSDPHPVDTFSQARAEAMYKNYSSKSPEELKASQKVMAKFMCIDSTRWDSIAAWGQRSDRKTMAYTMTEMLSKDQRKDIGTITVPVLVLAAYAPVPQYPAYTRDAVAQQYGEQYKECKQCMVHISATPAKHFIMYDAPDWFYKEIDTFLR